MSSKQHYVITIDGPCGAGKTTLARALSLRLGVPYLDTGAMFRTLARGILDQDGALSAFMSYEQTHDDAAVKALVSPYAQDAKAVFEDGCQRMYLSGEDVTDKLRTQPISDLSSRISVFPSVRDYVLAMERAAASGSSLVAEGRDTGTAVYPDARLKFFLTADDRVRASRRMRDTPGQFDSIEHAIAALKARDARDTSRDCAPLVPAQDAVRVDTTRLTVAETVRLMLLLAKSRGILPECPDAYLPCIWHVDSPEYGKLTQAAMELTRLTGMDCLVRNVPFDKSQNWYWTCIVARRPDEHGRADFFQLLAPKEWNFIIHGTDDEYAAQLDAIARKYTC